MSIGIVEIPFGQFIHSTIIYWVVIRGMIVIGMSVSNRGKDASVGKSYSSKCNSEVYGLLECDSSIENTEQVCVPGESVLSETGWRTGFAQKVLDEQRGKGEGMLTDVLAGADAERGYCFQGISI